MKTIIAGSRGIDEYQLVVEAIQESGFKITEIVSGEARGPDTLGEQWGQAHGIPIARFPAKWDVHGKSAGFIRNNLMSSYAEALVAVWDGKSRGTRHMIESARKKGLKVYVKVIS